MNLFHSDKDDERADHTAALIGWHWIAISELEEWLRLLAAGLVANEFNGDGFIRATAALASLPIRALINEVIPDLLQTRSSLAAWGWPDLKSELNKLIDERNDLAHGALAWEQVDEDQGIVHDLVIDRGHRGIKTMTQGDLSSMTDNVNRAKGRVQQLIAKAAITERD